MFEKKLWISHSALSSFERCPHLYYLEYLYKNPKTGNRIQVINPYLSLGSAVHDTVEGLLDLPLKERGKVSLVERYSEIFDTYRGLKGGFISDKKENYFFERGLEMIKNVAKTNFLEQPTVEMKTNFPTISLFSKKEIGIEAVLVGNIDWIQVQKNEKAHVIDFKTGNNKEPGGSLQLPIYALLAKHNLEMDVDKFSYWYLQQDLDPTPQDVGDLDEHLKVIKEKTLAINQAINDNNFPCDYAKKCFSCRDYNKIFEGEAQMVSSGGSRKKDVFCVFKESEVLEKIIEEDFLDEREKKIVELRITDKDADISKELRLDKERLDKITEEIKYKLKNNLRPQELKIVVKMLKK